MTAPAKQVTPRGMMYLSVVYVVWSSTYLAIRLAVGPNGGFAPFALGASRVAVAGFILLGIAALRGHRVRVNRRELATLAVSGILLWVGGNGLVLWAEQTAASGFAALMVSSTPIWVAGMNAVLDRKKPSWLLAVSLIVGFLGLVVLMYPSIGTPGNTGWLPPAALVCASFLWGVGSLVQSRRPVSVSPPVTSAYQHLAAGVAFLLISLLLGEKMPHPSVTAWAAWGYLVVFGSILAFTSYIYALELLPINIAMTYSYVNPVLALALGWWLLDETITLPVLGGAAMVVLGVVGVFRDRARQVPPADPLEVGCREGD
ncbi:MAG: EamA family transporter [Solirubrobacterales bacterium]